MSLNPEDTYVHLAINGKSQTMLGGQAFWSLPESEMAQFDDGWLISEFTCSEDWSNWEMHPNGDEFVYLLSGDIEFYMELASGTTSMRFTERGAVIVPQGTWHTAKVFGPSRMFFITRGGGTQHRPVSGA